MEIPFGWLVGWLEIQCHGSKRQNVIDIMARHFYYVPLYI